MKPNYKRNKSGYAENSDNQTVNKSYFQRKNSEQVKKPENNRADYAVFDEPKGQRQNKFQDQKYHYSGDKTAAEFQNSQFRFKHSLKTFYKQRRNYNIVRKIRKEKHSAAKNFRKNFTRPNDKQLNLFRLKPENS